MGTVTEVVIDGFKWVEDTSQFNKTSENATIKIMMRNIFLKLMSNILKNYMTLKMIYFFYLKE